MAESFIRRLQPDREGLDFEGLRKQGIRLVQDICGEVWTDYNLHDPGVTILEACCYALTDLVYRARFDVGDYLAAEDGRIDFGRQALHRPDEIFPSNPVTERDYRKLILSCDPDIDNVWIRPDDAGEAHGLYRIYVLMNDDVEDKKAIVDKVRRRYLGNRNLCEDLAGIEIVERIPYSVCGEIEIGGKREPAKVLAELHFECTQYLCPAVPVHSYIGGYKQGKALEELFDGVRVGPGYIDDAELYPWRGSFSISDLIGRIARIEGVRNINRLQFVDAAGNKSDTITLAREAAYRQVPSLHYASRQATGASGGEGVRFVKSGKQYQVQIADVEEEHKRLAYKRRISRQRKQHFDWIGTMMPGGTYRNVREYYSLQNHLPDIYGMNAYGVPESAPAERKAQAAQLKAYLLFFDQVMANFLENLQQAQRLFSLDEDLDRSYFHQVLRDDGIAGIEALYADGTKAMEPGLGRLMKSFDHFGNRRNRMLDYLLGLYGESLLQSSLRHLRDGGANFEAESIGNKIAFLKDIMEITGKRSVSFDYSRSADGGRNIPILKKKLAYLLGLRGSDKGDPSGTKERTQQDGGPSVALAGRQQDHDRKATAQRAVRDAAASYGAVGPRAGGMEASSETETGSRGDDYDLVEHILLRPVSAPSRPEASVPDDFYAFSISFVFPGDAEPFANTEFRKLVVETIHLNCPAHIRPDVHWLDSTHMARFIALRDRWLALKRASSAPSGELDEAAGALAHFLYGFGDTRG